MTVKEVPTTVAPEVPELSPLLLLFEEESLLVEVAAEPVAVPVEEEPPEVVAAEDEDTNGFESEEIEAWERSKSNCL